MFQRRVVGRGVKGSYPIKSWIYFALWFSNFSWCVSPCAIAVVHMTTNIPLPDGVLCSMFPERRVV